MHFRTGLLWVSAVVTTLLASGVYAATRVRFDLPPQSLAISLREVATQTGVNLLIDGVVVEGYKAPALKAELTLDQALARLLAGTGLQHRFLDDKTVTIVRSAKSSPEPAKTVQSTPPAVSTPQPVQMWVSEVLVVGSRSLNTDIRRSRNDAQPYVVFDQAVLRQSGAVDLDDFLRTRLPANVAAISNAQFETPLGATSQVNLRGLGPDETLILVDGRRIAGTVFQGIPTQPDVNTLPLRAIQRIEVLPTTASGIHGGSATGGALNIVLKRDYSGFEAGAGYDNSFRADSGIVFFDANGGFTFEEGRSRLLFSGSAKESHGLEGADRRFATEARQRLAQNNPSFIPNAPLPPLGATPNIRTLDGSPLFGPATPAFTSVPIGYPGGGGIAPLAANAGTYNLDAPATAQSPPQGLHRSLLTESRTESFSATIRRDFTERLEAFVDLGLSRARGEFRTNGAPNATFVVDTTAPNNPFSQPVWVTIPIAAADGDVASEVNHYRASGGIIYRLTGEWSLSADFTRDAFEGNSSSPRVFDTAAAGAAIVSGTIDVFRDLSNANAEFTQFLSDRRYTPSRSSTENAVIRAGGPLLSLPAGDLMLSGSLEWRNEVFDESRQIAQAASAVFPERSQEVNSAYLEANIPLISERSRVPGLRLLELQFAARFDDYLIHGAPISLSDGDPRASFGNDFSSINPTIALRYRPFSQRSFTFRGSYGTGFLPPGVSQLAPTINGGVPFPILGFFGLVDPRRGNTAVTSGNHISGGNSNLKPEESESWSVGAIWSPAELNNLFLSIDFVSLTKTGNIASFPGGEQALLDNESLVPNRVVRGEKLPGDPAEWAGIILSLDNSFLNIARADIEAFDLQAECRFDTLPRGSLDVFAMATLQTRYDTRAADGAPTIKNVGVGLENPLRLRGNIGATWKHGTVTAGLVVRHLDSYQVSRNPELIANQGTLKVPSQTFIDLHFEYRFGTLGDTELQLNMRNVTAEEPPLDAASGTLFSPLGEVRGATYSMALRHAF